MSKTTDAVQRECVLHEGIDGTWHHYGHLSWWSPDELYDSEYERPECPVTQLASTEKAVGCSQITERLTAEDGRGAWVCGWHGVFRVFGYPTDAAGESEQTTLVVDDDTR